MKFTRLICSLVIAMAVVALPATADTFNLTLGNTPIGVPPGTPGNWGTVTLTNTGGGSGGSGQVTIDVKLGSAYTFAGGSGRFGFNSDVALTDSMFAILFQDDSFVASTTNPAIGSTSYDGFGKFNVSWDGGSSPSGTELKFTVTAAGITAADLEQPSDKGFDFAAHVFDPNLGTGSNTLYVGNGSAPPAVPEPASLTLLGAGLSALGLFARRKLGK